MLLDFTVNWYINKIIILYVIIFKCTLSTMHLYEPTKSIQKILLSKLYNYNLSLVKNIYIQNKKLNYL